MNNKLPFFAGFTVAVALQICSTVMAIPITITGSATPDLMIPDNDLNGVASTISLNGPVSQITGSQLYVNMAGGFNGDYYAYIEHNSDLVVLLNNLGSTPSNPYGSSGSGFDVVFSDMAPNISTSPTSPGFPLTGVWAPQVGSLSTFNGMNPNGDWTLFIADESSGGVGTLENWGLSVTGNAQTTVPDDGSTLQLLVIAVGVLSLWSWRERRTLLT